MNTPRSIPYAMPVRDVAEWLPDASVPGAAEDRIESHARGARLWPTACRRLLTGRGMRFEPRALAFINLKGGVGKTTSALAVATRAVQYGFTVCVLDLDAQGSAGLALGIVAGDNDLVFHDIWQAPRDQCRAALVEIQPGFAVLPSSLDNSLLDVSLVNPAAQKNAVRQVCAAVHELGYEICVIDCPPSLGAATISAACAADRIVIPAVMDALSFRGIDLTLQEIRALRETFGLGAVDLRVLPTRVDGRQRLSNEYPQRLADRFGAAILLPPIHASTDFARAMESGVTVFAGAGRSRARAEYDRITRLLLDI